MGDKGLKASMECLENALQNGAFDRYFYQKLNEFHQENVMNERIEKGKLEGRLEGKEEEKLEIAINLKNEGIPIEIIAKTTELPISEVKKL